LGPGSQLSTGIQPTLPFPLPMWQEQKSDSLSQNTIQRVGVRDTLSLSSSVAEMQKYFDFATTSDEQLQFRLTH
jgi:hypothetical protein